MATMPEQETAAAERSSVPPDDGARLDALIDVVRARLTSNRRVRRRLGQLGRLHVDRLLPFLLLYRRPTDRLDPGTDELVISEAAYLTAVATPGSDRFVRKLVRALAELAFEQFGSFFLLELWSRPATENAPGLKQPGEVETTSFTVHYPKSDPVAADMAQILAHRVARVPSGTSEANARVLATKLVRPPYGQSVLSLSAARELHCAHLGLEIEASYQGPEGSKAFPMILRSLRGRLGRAIRRTFYSFTEQQTTLRPKNYQVLGRRAVVKAVWEVDRQLDEVASAYDFLVTVNPVNLADLWNGFRHSGFEKAPPFRYRPLPFDPSTAKRKLFSVPIERVEDPTLAELFFRKQMELDRQITMLVDRGTSRFLFGSMSLYGVVAPELKRTAEEILEQLGPNTREEGSRKRLDTQQVVDRALREVAAYHALDSEFSAEVEVRSDVLAGLMVSRGRLLVSDSIRVAEQQAEALVHHEIGTHLVTYHNGRVQRFTQLRSGLAGYDELQEGLAILAEYLSGGLSPSRVRILAVRVLGADMVMNGATFIDVFRVFRRWGFSPRTAFNVCVRLFRGGGFTKDLIYLRGLKATLGYLEKGGDLESLYLGKIALRDVPLVTELMVRKIVSPPRIMPMYLATDDGRRRMARLREGAHVLDLVGH
jgi:uncharacterized protein (TIGR02421 family)